MASHAESQCIKSFMHEQDVNPFAFPAKQWNAMDVFQMKPSLPGTVFAIIYAPSPSKIEIVHSLLSSGQTPHWETSVTLHVQTF